MNPYDNSSFSDAQLDAAYEAARQAGDQIALDQIATVIINRSTSVAGWAEGVLGFGHSFPNFERHTKFASTQAAQSSVVDSVKNLFGNVQSGASSLVNNIGSGIKTVSIAGVIVAGIVVYYGFIKKR